LIVYRYLSFFHLHFFHCHLSPELHLGIYLASPEIKSVISNFFFSPLYPFLTCAYVSSYLFSFYDLYKYHCFLLIQLFNHQSIISRRIWDVGSRDLDTLDHIRAIKETWAFSSFVNHYIFFVGNIQIYVKMLPKPMIFHREPNVPDTSHSHLL